VPYSFGDSSRPKVGGLEHRPHDSAPIRQADGNPLRYVGEKPTLTPGAHGIRTKGGAGAKPPTAAGTRTPGYRAAAAELARSVPSVVLLRHPPGHPPCHAMPPAIRLVLYSACTGQCARRFEPDVYHRVLCLWAHYRALVVRVPHQIECSVTFLSCMHLCTSWWQRVLILLGCVNGADGGMHEVEQAYTTFPRCGVPAGCKGTTVGKECCRCGLC
jgi:hypothetical protein